jgi:hypothetical protein
VFVRVLPCSGRNRCFEIRNALSLNIQYELSLKSVIGRSWCCTTNGQTWHSHAVINVYVVMHNLQVRMRSNLYTEVHVHRYEGMHCKIKRT